MTVRYTNRDTKHADIGKGIRDGLALQGVHCTLTVARSADEVATALAAPADVLVVLGHSGWDGNRWTTLLGVERRLLTGLIEAGTVLFATCSLLEEPGLAELVARPTPVVACKTRAEFDRTTVIVPALLTELSRSGRSGSWADSLPHALERARQSARGVAPRAWWHLWQDRHLQPRNSRHQTT